MDALAEGEVFSKPDVSIRARIREVGRPSQPASKPLPRTHVCAPRHEGVRIAFRSSRCLLFRVSKLLSFSFRSAEATPEALMWNSFCIIGQRSVWFAVLFLT